MSNGNAHTHVRDLAAGTLFEFEREYFVLMGETIPAGSYAIKHHKCFSVDRKSFAYFSLKRVSEEYNVLVAVKRTQ